MASGISGAMLRADFRAELKDFKADSVRSGDMLRAEVKADIQGLAVKLDDLSSDVNALRNDLKISQATQNQLVGKVSVLETIAAPNSCNRR